MAVSPSTQTEKSGGAVLGLVPRAPNIDARNPWERLRVGARRCAPALSVFALAYSLAALSGLLLAFSHGLDAQPRSGLGPYLLLLLPLAAFFSTAYLRLMRGTRQRAVAGLAHALGRAPSKQTEQAIAPWLRRGDELGRLARAALALAGRAREDVEQHYALAVRFGRAAVWEMWPGEGKMHYDGNLNHLLGFREGELGEDLVTLSALIPRRDQVRIRRALSAVCSGESPEYSMEHRVIRKDGGIGWVRSNGRLVSPAASGSLHLLGTTVDITQAKRAEEALRVSEERFARAFHASPDPIFITRLEDGRIVAVNEGFERLSGYRAEEVVGRTSLDLGLWVQAEVRERMVNTLREKGRVRNMEVDGRLRTGEIRRFLIAAEPMEVERAPHLLTVSRDITEQRRALEALRASEERYRSVYDVAPLAFVIWDREGLIQGWNDQAERMFGWSRAEVLGRSFFEFLVPERERPSVEQVVKALLEGKTMRHVVNENLAKDGGVILCEWNSSVCLDEEGRVASVISLALDITERKRAEDEVRRLNTDLEERVRRRTAELEVANRELEAFSYSVSHDLRTPLNTVDGFSRILLEEYGEGLDEEARDYLFRTRRAVGRMVRLVDDLLALSRATRRELRCGPLDLTLLAREVTAELSDKEPRRDVAMEIAPGLSAYGDRALLRVVLLNLLGNAWKYTARRDGARIEFGEEFTGGESVFFVRDDGAGFDMRHADRLFQPFQRLHGAGDFEGSGVGLATVKRIVDRHGGKVWARAEPGNGATFYFTLAPGKSADAVEDPRRVSAPLPVPEAPTKGGPPA